MLILQLVTYKAAVLKSTLSGGPSKTQSYPALASGDSVRFTSQRPSFHERDIRVADNDVVYEFDAEQFPAFL